MSIIENIDGVWAETGTKESTLTDEKKSIGHAGGDDPLTSRFNYLFNRDDVAIDDIIDYINANANMINICNWEKILNDPSVFPLYSVLYHPGIGRWLAYEGISSTYKVFASADGHQWITTEVHNLSNWGYHRNNAIDLTRYLIPTTDNDIEYSTDGDSTWAKELDATIGGTGFIRRIATKYPDSNFTMLVRDADDIRIAATGIGGGWVAPTTPPDNTGKIASGLIYIGGTSWVLIANLVNACKVHISTDDGDTWVETAPNPAWYPILDCRNLKYNPDRGTLMVCGGISGGGGGARISRSDDLGATPWTVGVFSDGATGPPLYSTSNIVNDIMYCGNDTWVAVGDAGTDLYGLWVSRDDGITWRFVYAHKQTVGETLESMDQIAKSENQLITVGNAGRSLRTLSRADAFTF